MYEMAQAAAVARMTRKLDTFAERRVKRPTIANAANGSAGMSQASTMVGLLVLQQVDVLDLDGVAQAVDRDHDRQPDGRLGGGDGHDEDREHLAGQLLRGVDVAGERDHHDVDRVQHQLDREQDADGIAPRERAVHPDAKEDDRQHEEVLQANRYEHHGPTPLARSRSRRSTRRSARSTRSRTAART